jgi:hypothetical protein
MSIFGDILGRIFGQAQAQPSAAAQPKASPQVDPSARPQAPASGQQAAQPSPQQTIQTASNIPYAPGTAPAPYVDIVVVLDNLAAGRRERLDWRRSIVDLMKLLDLDSSLAARKDLAKELQYKGDMGDSAAMNIWLHRQVMLKLEENGGKVPDDLKH